VIDSALGVAGIVVSVILFLIGYRQTVGARRERIRSANVEVEKILVRRIVLEGYTPTRADVTRLLQGKARDFKVSNDDLLSEAQVLNTVYTRIVESDLIPTDQREEILKRILPSLSDAEASPISAMEERPQHVSRMLTTTTVLLGVMAAAASAVGGLVSVLPDITSATVQLRELAVPALATIIASFIVLSTMIALFRMRASQEAIGTKAGEIDRYVAFEMEVARVMRRQNANIRRATPQEGADFVLELPGKRVLVEAKSWMSSVPVRMISELTERLSMSIQRTGADEAVVVTPGPVRESGPIPADAPVKFMTLQELRNYVAQSTRQQKVA
jgi:HJR/Mrr/RecB family endonuclease